MCPNENMSLRGKHRLEQIMSLTQIWWQFKKTDTVADNGSMVSRVDLSESLRLHQHRPHAHTHLTSLQPIPVPSPSYIYVWALRKHIWLDRLVREAHSVWVCCTASVGVCRLHSVHGNYGESQLGKERRQWQKINKVFTFRVQRWLQWHDRCLQRIP